MDILVLEEVMVLVVEVEVDLVGSYLLIYLTIINIKLLKKRLIGKELMIIVVASEVSF
jgi:hypothetical protein